MYAKLQDGVTIAQYPYTLNQLYADFPNVSFGTLSDDVLAEFNVVRVCASGVEYDQLTQYIVEKQPALVGTTWTQQWEVKDYDATTMAARIAALRAKQEEEYTAALEAHYDAKAKERRYDNRYTCALRAGYPGPFQAEGIAFATWMDNCNAVAYQILADVLNGLREVPTVEQLISELPDLAWPA